MKHNLKIVEPLYELTNFKNNLKELKLIIENLISKYGEDQIIELVSDDPYVDVNFWLKNNMYQPEEQRVIIEFLERCIKFIKLGEISSYKDSTLIHELEFNIKPKNNLIGDD